MKPSGSRVPLSEVPDTLGRALNRGLGQANMERRALGSGVPQHGNEAGVQNAVYSQVKLSGASPGIFDVPHNLGEVPVLCELVEWDNPLTPATFLIARPVNKDKWTATACRVQILAAVGAFAGCLATFKVKGA
jgi:hypothetical protein